MFFSEMIGLGKAKLALVLNCIDPCIGGVLLLGDKGTGKSTLARAVARLLPDGMPWVEVPLNVTEDALMESVDLEDAVRTGRHTLQPGLLARARGGVLFIDDVNLLNSDILNLILTNRDNGAGFSLIATMNPQEGPISSKLIDHFGLCALFETPARTALRLKVLKRSDRDEAQNGWFENLDARLRKRIDRARAQLDAITVPDEATGYAVEACMAACIEGHRGDLALERAARAYAGFCLAGSVSRKHVERVLPLALIHRKRELMPPEEEEIREQELKEPENRDKQTEPEDRENESSDGSSDSGPGGQTAIPKPREGRPREEVFQTGEPFKVRRISFRKDRLERRVSGRRTSTRFAGKGGRYVKSILRAREPDIAADATLRAAAPWQLKRGRTGSIIIRDEDFRFKQREKKMGHLVIFVVDCSGSMGAKRRMIETKGAVLSLLMDCYHKRDKVSLIAFRKDRAEVVIPPTSSVELASRKLQDIPVGGKTPLPAALFTTYNLIRQVRIKEPQMRFVVAIVSDGRANQGQSGMPVREEIARGAAMLKEQQNTDFIIVDTEDKSGFMRADLARRLAGALGADYFTADDLKADYLAGLVSSRTV